MFSGLKKGGTVLVNTSIAKSLFNFPEEYSAAVVDAAGIAVKHNIGTKSMPIVNTSILGAFAKFTGIVGIEAIVEAVREGVPIMRDKNAEAAMEAYNSLEPLLKVSVDLSKEPSGEMN